MSVAEELLSPPATRSVSVAFAFTIGAIAVVLAIYWLTTWSLISTWLRSDTFAHGMLVFPATSYLIYNHWRTTGGVTLSTGTPALLALALATLAWVLATIADVLVVQQFALVTMVPILCWLLLGPGFVRSMAFPLGFLIFAVPFGESLIPHLMEFTAVFTVSALEMTGIPVFREGMYFSIPSGDFEVAKACSGIRYLIGSLSLGSLYAYLTYRSYWRRAVFILAAAIVPIVANGLRAYLIVLLAHFSEMKLAVGVDHLIYGWLFFGIVMFVLFMVGRYFRDDDIPTGDAAALRAEVAAPPVSRLVAVVLPALAIVGFGPLFFDRVDAMAETNSARYAPRLPHAAGGWVRQAEATIDWKPEFTGTRTEITATYLLDDRAVHVFLVGYQRQTQDAELVNNENRLYDRKRWRRLNDSTRLVDADGSRKLSELQLRRGPRKLQIWHWYRTGGEDMTSEFAVKLTEVREVLAGRADSAALVALAVETDIESDDSALLADFVAAHARAIAACIDTPGTAECAP